MPKAYPRDLEAAIKSNCMSALEKARFVRYTAGHFYAQQPNPTPTDQTSNVLKFVLHWQDSPETAHKVVNNLYCYMQIRLWNTLGQTFN